MTVQQTLSIGKCWNNCDAAQSWASSAQIWPAGSNLEGSPKTDKDKSTLENALATALMNPASEVHQACLGSPFLKETGKKIGQPSAEDYQAGSAAAGNPAAAPVAQAGLAMYLLSTSTNP